ncbi:glucitol operon GutQ protein [Klebsiella pneumoniae]|uniref:Glucitol operon GutQ protein n=1 Tax=Klebsiella pneumoniae TaxID=573 RepID=A0A377U0M1_KLEPN|nr:glucitol operon GutQ protein [Klebsiella pneumoniae]
MLGDALAMAVMQARGFNEEDFARSHPAGALGARLLNKVHHLMRRDEEVPRSMPRPTSWTPCLN